ncbi:hypothetical protein Tco_1133540 [Tanacetum coccineum]
MGFKPAKDYRPVSKNPTANISGNKKKGVEPTKEVSTSNSFDVLNSVDNYGELGTNGGTSNLDSNRANSSGSSFWNVETSSTSTTPIIDKIGKIEKLIMDGKVTLVDDDGIPLKKLIIRVIMIRDSIENGDYDEDPYDDDMYEGHDIPNKIQDICDNLDIRVRGLAKSKSSVGYSQGFNDFLTLYPIPSEYHVILPKSNQTIFNDLPGFIYLGLTLLVVSSLPLLLSCARLMVMIPLSTSSKGSLICVELVITGIEGWHERFFYVQDSIIHAKYSQLLFEQNKLDSKSFKDKLPLNIEENSMFKCLGRYPTSVRVFPDPILFLAGLKPSEEHDDENLSFFPKEPSSGFDIGSPSISINTKPLKADEELVNQHADVTADYKESPKPKVFFVHPRSVDARIKDRKLSNDEKGLPDVLKLKDATACHLKIFAITPLAWKNHLDNHIDVELLDLHDRCYARQVIVDNTVNRISRELLQVIGKLRCEFDVMKDRERAREKECEEQRAKYDAAMTEFKKNPTVVALQDKISTLSTKVKENKEVNELKQDRSEVVSKVVPYAAMKLVHSDHMGILVGRLVSFAILYRRCRAYEQVADIKEPFNLSKVKGYCSSYKKDHIQAINDLATATFPWLDGFVADPSTPVEALLSKKPSSLQRPAPSRTQVPFPSSQRATPSLVLVSNPMSPPADVSVVKP